MAVSLCFGLLVATILTLLYVPALYLIVQDITNLFKGREQPVTSQAGSKADAGDQVAEVR
jgi:uncharacterized protein (UPF0333 family)